MGPLDLVTRDFYSARKKDIDKTLEHLASLDDSEKVRKFITR
jgi:hypothetical protein